MDIFPGSGNSLKISRKYSTTFVCDFRLVLYPFDEQYCDLHFRMLSASKNYLKFEYGTADVIFSGSKELVEYEVSTIIKKYNINVQLIR